MADYLVDFYSENNRLFRSSKIYTMDNVAAKLKAKELNVHYRAASYKITLLESTGNLVIYGAQPMLPELGHHQRR